MSVHVIVDFFEKLLVDAGQPEAQRLLESLESPLEAADVAFTSERTRSRSAPLISGFEPFQLVDEA